MEAIDDNIIAFSDHHILAITLPLHGHAIRLFRLSMKLASMGFTVTFISTQSQLKSIAHDAGPFISMNKICLASIDDAPNLANICDDDGQSLDFNIRQRIISMVSMTAEIEKLVQSAEAKHNSPVSCIFSDAMFLPYLGPIRDKRSNCRIVAVAYSCASFWLLDKHLGKRMADGGINFSVLPATIPDFPTALQVEDFPLAFLAKQHSVDYLESLYKLLEQVNWFVINTFEELEGYALDALRQTFKLPVISVGPLHICKGIEKEEEEEEADSLRILSWLSTKQPRSVLYISFGSMASLSAHNIHELAMALDAANNHSFLWVMRPTSLLQFLPEGFMDRSKERGLIVEWCPQVQVLKHASVQAFLTHGGWNSVLEAVSSGVPLLGWPQVAEQNLNCKLVVDAWKIGSRINSTSEKLDGSTRKVGREEIESGIRDVMEGARSREMKERAMELQAAARRAVADNGSSTLHLRELVDSIMMKGKGHN